MPTVGRRFGLVLSAYSEYRGRLDKPPPARTEGSRRVCVNVDQSQVCLQAPSEKIFGRDPSDGCRDSEKYFKRAIADLNEASNQKMPIIAIVAHIHIMGTGWGQNRVFQHPGGSTDTFSETLFWPPGGQFLNFFYFS